MEIVDVVENNIFGFLDNRSMLYFCMASKKYYNCHYHVLSTILIAENLLSDKFSLSEKFMKDSILGLADDLENVLGELFEDFTCGRSRVYSYEFYEFNQMAAIHIGELIGEPEHQGILSIAEKKMNEF
jgi:hypothetical protein